MDQCEQLPLAIHLGLDAQREAIESLVGAHVAEDRLDRGEASPVLLTSPRAVDALAHTLAVGCLGFAGEHGDLARSCALGFEQALRTQGAAFARAVRRAKLDRGVATYSAVLAIAVQALAGRAHGVRLIRRDEEVTAAEHLGFSILTGLVVQRIGLDQVLVLLGETFVAPAHGVVGDQGVDALFGQRCQAGLLVIIGVGGDLMRAIDGGDADIALHHAMTALERGTFGVAQVFAPVTCARHSATLVSLHAHRTRHDTQTSGN